MAIWRDCGVWAWLSPRRETATVAALKWSFMLTTREMVMMERRLRLHSWSAKSSRLADGPLFRASRVPWRRVYIQLRIVNIASNTASGALNHWQRAPAPRALTHSDIDTDIDANNANHANHANHANTDTHHRWHCAWSMSCLRLRLAHLQNTKNNSSHSSPASLGHDGPDPYINGDK